MVNVLTDVILAIKINASMLTVQDTHGNMATTAEGTERIMPLTLYNVSTLSQKKTASV
jgi:hypothetical protein